jgi:multidrug resistance efflux pump
VASIQKALANQRKARSALLVQQSTVAQVQAQLAKAEWDLKQTTIYAPADGLVTDLLLNEGSAISIPAGNAMINFIPDDEPVHVIASIAEKNLRYVKPGQAAEVVLPLYPGETLTGKVEEVVWVTGEGQVLPQQPIPEVAQRVKTGGKFSVKIRLDPEWADYRLPIGASGVAAIYTDHGKPTFLIRKVMLRMTAWTNYVFQQPGQ